MRNRAARKMESIAILAVCMDCGGPSPFYRLMMIAPGSMPKEHGKVFQRCIRCRASNFVAQYPERARMLAAAIG